MTAKECDKLIAHPQVGTLVYEIGAIYPSRVVGTWQFGFMVRDHDHPHIKPREISRQMMIEKYTLASDLVRQR